MLEKQKLRKLFLEKRSQLSQKEVDEKSEAIYQNLITSSLYAKCERIFVYVSMKNEVNTTKIINKGLSDGKIIAVPKVIPQKKEMIFSQINSLEELERGHFNVLEPKEDHIRPMESNKRTLILVPGAVFDINKNRIGYGGGYYDKYLNQAKEIMNTVGIGYDFQVIEKIPRDTYDIPLDYILTDKNWIK